MINLKEVQINCKDYEYEDTFHIQAVEKYSQESR
jgi:hypothetical protein